MTHNLNCDGCWCVCRVGEVKRLPHGDSGGADILCHACFNHEIEYRKERNVELEGKDTGSYYDLPLWKDLEVYNA